MPEPHHLARGSQPPSSLSLSLSLSLSVFSLHSDCRRPGRRRWRCWNFIMNSPDEYDTVAFGGMCKPSSRSRSYSMLAKFARYPQSSGLNWDQTRHWGWWGRQPARRAASWCWRGDCCIWPANPESTRESVISISVFRLRPPPPSQWCGGGSGRRRGPPRGLYL